MKRIYENIELAIKQLNLQEKDIISISLGNMKKICEIAKCNMSDLMYYLRFVR